ncbi:major facilitator superfamily domain-containing protein [Hyaloraphidium curvatum]|nr:major facilitator superfamily domain-containing protein [Hyaloraphidium curvatum]
MDTGSSIDVGVRAENGDWSDRKAQALSHSSAVKQPVEAPGRPEEQDSDPLAVSRTLKDSESDVPNGPVAPTEASDSGSPHLPASLEPKEGSPPLEVTDRPVLHEPATTSKDAGAEEDSDEFTMQMEELHHDPSDELHRDPGDGPQKVLSATESFNQTISRLGPPPEGGWGWLVMVAAFFTCALAGGSDWAFGVYQSYFYSNQIFPGSTNRAVALVGSVSAGCFGIFGIVAGRLTDTWGPRNVVVTGACIYVVGLVLASFSVELWQLFLTQGLIKGIGASFTYYPPLSIIPQYFDKRRGLAMGIAVSGVGMGGFALGPGTQAMLDRFGFRWALRITALVAAIVYVFVAIAMRPRFPRLRGAPLLDFSKLRQRRFWLAFGALLAIQFGFFTITIYTPLYSVYIGLTANQGANLVGFLNLFSFFGRIFQGFTSDLMGAANTFVICVFVGALCDLVFWPFSFTFASQMGLMFLYGFVAGGYASTLPLTLVKAFGTAQIGTTLGMVYVAFVPGGLVGPVIGGAIIDSQTTTLPDGTVSINWIPVQMYGGFTLLLGAVITCLLRFDLAGGKVWMRL